MEFCSSRIGFNILERASVAATIVSYYHELAHGIFVDGIGAMDYMDLVGTPGYLG